jgi:hypothetical protein
MAHMKVEYVPLGEVLLVILLFRKFIQKTGFLFSAKYVIWYVGTK